MRNFTIITLISIVIISIWYSIAPPSLMRQSLVVPADFNIQQQEQEIQEKIDFNVQPQEKIVETPKVVQQVTMPKQQKTTVKPQTPKQPTQKQTTIKTQPKKVEPKAEPKVVTKPIQQKVEQVKKEEPKKQVKPEHEIPKVLTPEEETIVWNKWHSDLQNKIMADSNISANVGTVFYFTFTVDKFGNISNIRTWSSDSTQTSQAVRVIKPVIASYQGTEILKFPEGTSRVILNFNGKFRVIDAPQNIYTKPSDYNDVERITR